VLTVFDYLVVGAGFSGSVIAERLAATGKSVLVVDRRAHLGGNAHDRYDAAGVLVHSYGPHIFHTNCERIARYLSRFTSWRPYQHRVLTRVNDQYLPFPINADTINAVLGTDMDELGVAAHLEEFSRQTGPLLSFQDAMLRRIGRTLYEALIENYTRKQWGTEPSQLSASLASRVVVRTNRDDRYFDHGFQAMPAEGFTRLFERMLANPKIDVRLSTDYLDIARCVTFRELIFTGSIDEYFGYCLGKLQYRSLHFEFHTENRERAQPAAVINFPNDHAYTRVTEFKYLTGQIHPKTTLVREFPCDVGEPHYPVPTARNRRLLSQYQRLAERLPDVHFLGRLGTYRYYDMDQCVAQALALFERLHRRSPAHPLDFTT
jgi:UDP-galactopyranose mutase